MIASGELLDPTRAVGLVAYVAATVCCGIAWVRDKVQRGDWQVAALLTLIESALLLDMVFNLRWKVHQFLMDFAMQKHEYQVRRFPQLIALIILAGLFLLGLLRIRRLSRGKSGPSLAASGVLLSLIVWCTEVVSLHQVDHVLYHRFGAIMAVSLLWALACLMTSMGVLSISRHAEPQAGSDIKRNSGPSSRWGVPGAVDQSDGHSDQP
jgi:hypothetical protein